MRISSGYVSKQILNYWVNEMSSHVPNSLSVSDICCLGGCGTSLSWLHIKYSKELSDMGILLRVCVCPDKVAETWKVPIIKENEDIQRYKLRINKKGLHTGEIKERKMTSERGGKETNQEKVGQEEKTVKAVRNPMNNVWLSSSSLSLASVLFICCSSVISSGRHKSLLRPTVMAFTHSPTPLFLPLSLSFCYSPSFCHSHSHSYSPCLANHTTYDWSHRSETQENK